jgi:hypothetical protein
MKAHGGQSIESIQDFVAEGTLTSYSAAGPYATYNVTMWRKGDRLVQTSIRARGAERRLGTDGTRTWDTIAGAVTAARGPALEFLETHTVRGVANLLQYQSRGSRLRDNGKRGRDRVLTVEETNGRTTTYVIDGQSALVTQLELVSGQAPDMHGRLISIVQSYVFSNFRPVQGGLPTAFKIEHFTNGAKVEELLFTSVRYNARVSDNVFHP